MKFDISAEEFSQLSGEKKKQYVARLFVDGSGAISVHEDDTPVAYVMAGLPGAGKTEFLDSIAEQQSDKRINPFVRIDLDEIVSAYPDYSPKDYSKFRSQGNIVLARTIDIARGGRYNMLVDGTFSGMSGASVSGIGKLLKAGYAVKLVYMYDSADSAWYYTMKREVETDRSIDADGFKRAAKMLVLNLQETMKLYGENPKFSLDVVKQKELRDKDYNIITQKDDIGKLLKLEYNLSNIRKESE